MLRTTFIGLALRLPLRRALPLAFGIRPSAGIPVRSVAYRFSPEAARGISQEAAPDTGCRWTNADLEFADAYKELKVEPSDYHLIIIHCCAKSAIYNLDIAYRKDSIPPEIHIGAVECTGSYAEININCKTEPLDMYIKTRLKGLPNRPLGWVRKLVVEIAECCALGKIS
ncbi:hypothetical protein K458DRAFT_389842 [Lentithecium fluviatile CBS 122367]|uniref:Uncharacterized protein n=1 Tax=Lentithecium fluviatile CBS 122367 TaxID=1168545 RepID=A0A6G1IYN5_9PLEO|nr:hypothetical protein K458DRAFT_389842 [Lentithecium fluviatile CBS 122367]